MKASWQESIILKIGMKFEQFFSDLTVANIAEAPRLVAESLLKLQKFRRFDCCFVAADIY